MTKLNWSFTILILISTGLILVFLILQPKNEYLDPGTSVKLKSTKQSYDLTEKSKSIAAKKFELKSPQSSKILNSNYHVFQTFNNCGPAALSMALRFYGINKTQQQLGDELRPYQIPNGNNDDKSVTLDEMAEKVEEYDLIPYTRPNGNIEIIQYFITYDIPVIAKTLLTAHDDIGHYRVIKGYDNEKKSIIQDDSYQGKNIYYSYDEFNKLWARFNYEYLVLVQPDKKQIAEEILGSNIDKKVSWMTVVNNNKKILKDNPEDVFSRFNLSIALYHTGDYKGAVNEYEKIKDKLPFRTLWYQIEPIKSYYYLGDYDEVMSITDKILNTGNRAYSELYIIRGDIYKKKNNLTQAKNEYEKAFKYNKNLKSAQQRLDETANIDR